MKFTLRDFPPQNFRDGATAPLVTVQVDFFREDNGSLIVSRDETGATRGGKHIMTQGHGSSYEAALANAYRDMIHMLALNIE